MTPNDMSSEDLLRRLVFGDGVMPTLNLLAKVFGDIAKSSEDQKEIFEFSLAEEVLCEAIIKLDNI